MCLGLFRSSKEPWCCLLNLSAYWWFMNFSILCLNTSLTFIFFFNAGSGAQRSGHCQWPHQPELWSLSQSVFPVFCLLNFFVLRNSVERAFTLYYFPCLCSWTSACVLSPLPLFPWVCSIAVFITSVESSILSLFVL